MFYRALWGLLMGLELPKFKMGYSGVQMGTPFGLSLQWKCKSIKSTIAPSQPSENVPSIMHKAVISDKVDPLNEF